MREFKDLCILTGGHIIQGAVLLLSTRLITSLLSPAQMGRFSIIYTIIALFVALFISSIGNYIQRKIIEWNLEDSVYYYTRLYIFYLFISGILFCIIVLFVKNVVGIGIDISNGWIAVLMFSLIFFPYLNSFFSGNLNIFKRRLWFIVCSNLTLFFGLIASVILVLLFFKTAEYWIAGQLLGQIIAIFISGALFYKIVRKPKKKEVVYPGYFFILSDVFRFVWPISVVSVILWIQSRSYLFLLKGIAGIEAVGFFTVGYNLSLSLASKFESLFYSFYDPFFFNEIANSNIQEKAEAWNKYAKAFFPAIIIVCIFICAGAPFIVKVFVAPEFQKITGTVMIWGGIISLLSMMVATYNKVGTARLDMRGLLAPHTLGTLVVFGGIFILCVWNPYIGAGLSLSLGAFSTLVYLMIKMYRLLPISFPKKRVIQAIIYSLPMAIAFIIFKKIIYNPTILQSIVVLTILGIYQLFAQIILAKDWILKSKISFIERVDKNQFLGGKMYEE